MVSDIEQLLQLLLSTLPLDSSGMSLLGKAMNRWTFCRRTLGLEPATQRGFVEPPALSGKAMTAATTCPAFGIRDSTT